MWDSPSRAAFGKVGSIMKRLRVPIDRHADGQLTEVLRKVGLWCGTAALILMPVSGPIRVLVSAAKMPSP